MELKTVMIIGAGQMGSGIAQVFAQKGFQVLINDINSQLIEKSLAGIAKNLEKACKKGKITEEEVKAVMARLKPAPDMAAASGTELVIEAATENPEIKKKIFIAAEAAAGQDTILATNTSSIPITELAQVTRRPDKVVGMHFMNPAPVMALVEIIPALQTSEDTFRFVFRTAEALGKTPVEVKDNPGFALNRVLISMINEAVFTVQEGIVSIEDVDKVMKFGANHPMGPMALADLIGLDTCLAIMEILHRQLGDDKYRPCPLLRKYVQAGWLGVKTGRGFYRYEK